MTAPTRKERRIARAAQQTRQGTRGRLVVIGAIALIVIGAILSAALLTGPRSARVPVLPISAAPASGDVDVAWYCAEGTSNSGGRADETIVIGNLGAVDADVDVTVHSAGKAQSRPYRIEAGAQRRVRVADIVASPEPGVTVYARSGRIVVEHQVNGSGDIALGPCARRSSSEWYFAAGSTVKGAFEWMALYNPFPEGAIVDIDVLTRDVTGETSTERPVERIQSINVPGQTRVTVPIHERVGRYAATGAAVRARFGRIVAERSLIFSDVNGQQGLAVSLGAPALARSLVFPEGRVSDARSEVVAVANPGDQPAQVVLASFFDGGISVEPTALTVNPRSVANISVPNSPQNLARTSQLTSSIPVAAEMRVATTKPTRGTGLATVMGEPAGYRTTTFAAARLSLSSTDRYRVFNPGPRTAAVRTRLFGAARTEGPEAILTPGASATLEMTGPGTLTNALLVVNADEPVVVVRYSEGGGITVSPGMPTP